MAKTDLIVQEKTVQSLEPIGDETIDAMRQKAQMMLDAKLMPAALNSVEKILTVALTGKELGIPFNMAVHNVYVINGRPSLSVHAIGSLLKKANVYYKCTEDFMRVDAQSGGEVTTETKETTVRTTFLFKTIWNKTVQEQSFSMTMREAALAGWADKEVWKSMPKIMLRNRTLAIGARLVAPDVLMGMYEVSEISDAGISFDEQGDPVIIR